LVASVRDATVGLVGEVSTVNPEPIQALQGMGYIVVVSPVAVDGAGGFLNVNADTAAAEIAVALGAERLVFLTDVEGIKGTDGTVAQWLQPEEARTWIERGAITGGMIPKVECGLTALRKGVTKVHILDGRVPHSVLLEIFTDAGIGTEITRTA
jgi:acetylglutamate kinase